MQPAEQPKLTPLEALQLLERATAQLMCSRDDHARLIEASQIVGRALMEASVQAKIAAQPVKADTDG